MKPLAPTKLFDYTKLHARSQHSQKEFMSRQWGKMKSGPLVIFRELTPSIPVKIFRMISLIGRSKLWHYQRNGVQSVYTWFLLVYTFASKNQGDLCAFSSHTRSNIVYVGMYVHTYVHGT